VPIPGPVFLYIHLNFLNASVPLYSLNTEDSLMSREFKSILNSELSVKIKKLHETIKHVLNFQKKISSTNYY